MAAAHHCIQVDKIAALGAQAERMEKEFYVGREGRLPVMVRIDRIERVVSKLVYVATALLVSALLGLGATLIRMAAMYASGVL